MKKDILCLTEFEKYHPIQCEFGRQRVPICKPNSADAVRQIK